MHKLHKESVQSDLEKSIDSFNLNVSKIFKLMKSKSKFNVDIHSYYNRFNLMKWSNKQFFIENLKDSIWDNRDAIIKKDATYMFNPDNFVFTDAEKKTFMKNIDYGEALVKKFSTQELEKFWEYQNIILKAVILYKIITANYKN